MVCLSSFQHPDKTLLFTGKVAGAGYEMMIDPENRVYLINRKVTTDTLRIAMGRPRNFKERIIARFVKSSRQKMLMDLRRYIEMYSKLGRNFIIVAPPFLVDALLILLEAEGKKFELGKHVWLFTGGGWKMQSGETVTGSEWRARIKAVLGIPEDNCRDGYGMSECSAYFPDCEGHYKHIPHSIVFPMLLDDELKPVKNGNTGRLAFLDPIPNSYPGFIITGDRVTMLPHCPVCNRPGPVFTQDISRIGGVESRGCAEIAGELMSNEMQKTK